MTNRIIDTAEFEEDLGPDDETELSDISATKEATGDRMEFHVQMRGYTLTDMEDLIVAAAAREIVGSGRDTAIKKAVESKAVEMIDAKATAALEGVTAEIIDHPMTPSFGDRKPVTMREFLGLYGKEYLTERVDRDGKPSKGGWATTTYTRMELIVMQAVERKFENEIEKATSEAVREVQAEIEKAHAAILEEQKARFREALEKATP